MTDENHRALALDVVLTELRAERAGIDLAIAVLTARRQKFCTVVVKPDVLGMLSGRSEPVLAETPKEAMP